MINSSEHFSFTVSNLDASLHFFHDLLGLEATPVIIVENDAVRQITGLPNAHLKISLVHIPDGKNIELVEYIRPRGSAIDLAIFNTGVAHIALNVTGIEKMYRDLLAEGVEFVSPPVWEVGNDGYMNQAVCYVKGPDGITLEFIERTA